MRISEFKSWLDGFEASFVDGHPAPSQYKKIKEMLEEVSHLGDMPRGQYVSDEIIAKHNINGWGR